MNRFYAFLASIAVLLLVALPPWMQNVQISSLEVFGGRAARHPDIAIVAIDSKSLSQVGRWPWDRTVHARLLEAIRTGNPRSVGFDISFSEVQNDASDAALASSIGSAGIPTVLAAQAVYFSENLEPEFKTPVSRLAALPNVRAGHVNAPVGTDGVARYMPGVISSGPARSLPFSAALAEAAGASWTELRQPSLSFAERFTKARRLISFSGTAGSFPTYSATDILSGAVPPETFRDKIVLIGATASELHDTVQTPLSGQPMSGVEWNATVLSNMLMNASRSLPPESLPLAVGFVLTLVGATIYTSARPKYGTVFFVVALAGLVALSLALWRQGLALPYLANTLALALVFFGQSVLRWIKSEREKRRIRENMQFYFSPQVMQLVMEHPEQLKLGGDRREVTVFFSDIRSFTTITESVPPEVLTALLYEYFSEMSEEIFATDGVLDKFIGDAIMAFWGAPLPQPDQADRAVKAALNMLKRLARLQASWQERGFPHVDIGIGINTGMATVGNLGSHKRFDYTVIGDCVNAASRLEGLNKQYGTHLIISESTRAKLTLPVTIRQLDEVLVKGKTKAIKIFEVSELKS